MAASLMSGSVLLNANAGLQAPQVHPTSIVSGWKTLGFVVTGTTAVTVGALGSTLSVATSIPFNRIGGVGTNVRIRVIYDDDATAVGTALKYKLWGHKAEDIAALNLSECWQVLPNRAGDYIVTPTFGFAASDTVVATDYRATSADIDEATHDCDGCDEFFIEITQGMALTGGTDSQARFQVKII